MKKLPTLYQRSATGAIQQWTIAVEEKMNCGVIVTTWGQVGGKLQETRDAIDTGKSVGRSNETTAIQQAEFEAEAKWRKKIEREGYVEDMERAEAGETDQEGGIPPMLAKPLEDVNPKHLKWPADVQRKVNGCRILAFIWPGGDVELWSRKQTPVLGVPHIAAALGRIFADIQAPLILDGECFKMGWSLQKISGYFRKEGGKPGFRELQYHVYDMPSHKGTWLERREALDDLFANYGDPQKEGVVLQHPTVTVNSEAEAWDYADKAVRDGWEGGILRQHATKYEAGKRSPGLAKLKRFKDEEFRILAVNEGRGKFVGKAVFTCQANNGKPFDCCAPGTMEDRAEFFRQGDALVGQQLTVRYFELSEDGTPIFPVGVAVRNYEG